jgi:hypothetical protein
MTLTRWHGFKKPARRKLRRLRIRLDFHEVIVNLQPIKRDILRWMNIWPPPGGIKREHLVSKKICTHEQYDQVSHKLHEERAIMLARPLPGATEYIELLLFDKHFIEIVTASDPAAFVAAIAWLEKHAPEIAHHPRLRVIGVGRSGNKCEVGRADVIVDDTLQHHIDAMRKGSTYVPYRLLMHRAHNAMYDEYGIAIRVKDWEDCYYQIRLIAESVDTP